LFSESDFCLGGGNKDKVRRERVGYMR
jgi:hypothetical protein